MTTGRFALDIAKFAEKAKARVDEIVSVVVANVAAEIDQRSPVGDATFWISPPPKGYVGGHFRANWQLGVGFIPSGVIAGVDPSGEATQGRILARIPEKASGKTFYLANNAPYARRIEDGWSRQAPQGVVGLTVVRWQGIVDDAAAKARD